VDLVALSRTLSHALRHAPHQYELELDDEGWVPLAAVLDVMQVEVDDLRRLMAQATKQRFELDEAGGRFRARYGHSVPGKLRKEAAAPPEALWHGTAPEVAAIIDREGLRPMGRQYVHLSIDRETALEVGRRKARAPVMLRVRAAAAAAAGVAFYAGNTGVRGAAVVGRRPRPGRYRPDRVRRRLRALARRGRVGGHAGARRVPRRQPGWRDPVARAQGVLPSVLATDLRIAMVSTRDIGRAAAAALLDPPRGRRVIELAGPREASLDSADSAAPLRRRARCRSPARSGPARPAGRPA
jgi:putative RNA 2'-phosphotransferase